MSRTLEPLIGTWRTEGEVLGDDGVTAVEGIDAYEWLGPFVVHRVDVVVAGRPTRARWTVPGDDGEPRLWMRLHLTRRGFSG